MSVSVDLPWDNCFSKEEFLLPIMKTPVNTGLDVPTSKISLDPFFQNISYGLLQCLGHVCYWLGGGVRASGYVAIPYTDIQSVPVDSAISPHHFLVHLVLPTQSLSVTLRCGLPWLFSLQKCRVLCVLFCYVSTDLRIRWYLLMALVSSPIFFIFELRVCCFFKKILYLLF